ncbi:MAG: hypothetical protein IKV32_05875 [Muribaculaceae bacterium]|nr:hypothetical protein [Muribaculaceae bacterium]
MLYLELLRGTLSVIIFSIFITLVIYFFVLWGLKKINKYNVRNFWFIICSIIFIPFLFFELSLYFAGSKVEENFVSPAHEYARSLAEKVDIYTSTAANTVNGTVDNFTSSKEELLPTNIVSELKKKYPKLSIFLTDKGINGDSSEDIITSIFGKVEDAITNFKLQRVFAIVKFAIVFIGFSLFFGWRKKKRKEKKQLLSSQQNVPNSKMLTSEEM